MNRVEVYIDEMDRFIRELKRAKAERVFYMLQKTQQEVPTTDKATSAYNLTATTILTAYIPDGEYALEARQSTQSPTIHTKEDYEKFDAEAEKNLKDLILKIQDEYPSCEIFKGALVFK